MENDQGDHGGRRGGEGDRPDAALVQSWLEAWLQIWLKYEGVLKACARRLVGRDGRGVVGDEDLLQLTYCRILTYPKNPAAVGEPLGYLLRIMRNKFHDELRKVLQAPTDSLDRLQGDPAWRGKLPAVEPEVLRREEEQEERRKFESLCLMLSAEDKALLEAFLDDPTLETCAAAAHEHIRYTKYRWNKLRSKMIRIAKIRNL